jgi:MFS family permease
MLSSFRAFPQFRNLWTSSLFFFAGIWMQTIILGWLVFDITNSEVQLAIFTAARLGPMLLGPFSGVVADRLDRARFMLATIAWATLVSSVLALLVSIGQITYWELVVGGFLLGLAQSPSQPARYTLVSDIVDSRHLSNANALNSMAVTMMQGIGPAIGGALISVFGVPLALWISVFWYPASFLALWPIRSVGRARPRGAATSARDQLVGGLRIVLSDRLMGSVLVVSFSANIFLWPIYQALMPVFARNVLHIGAGGLGLLLTVSGAGALAGSLTIAFLGDFEKKGAVFIYGTAIWGACWSLFALSRSLPAALSLMAAIGLASSTFALQSTLLLLLAPAEVRGRAMGLQQLAIGVLPLAALMQGALADLVGVSLSTLMSGATLVAIMLCVAARVPGLVSYSRPAVK